MSVVTIRIPEFDLEKIEKLSKKLRMSRNAYINRAITEFNSNIDLRTKKDILTKDSMKVRKNSMMVNKEFDAIEYNGEI